MSAPVHHVEAGSGEAVVFLHGVGGDAASWAPQIEAFSGEYRAIAWDMPGYGGSPALERMTFPALAEALLGLLDRLGLDRVHLVGHSMGGMVAQEFAATWPERVATLVLSATSPAFGRPDGDFQKRFVEARIAPLDNGETMADVADRMVAAMLGPSAGAEGAALARRSMAAVPEATYRAAIACLAAFDRRDALPGYRMPVLALAGEADATAPAPMMEKMAGRIPGAAYACLPGTGHLGNLESPAAFNEAVGNFLRRWRM
ncbi:MAG: alpha/beta fold hydrolase [Alphaproteobacteria bacterium]|nr:alpha/beta fold hydrolase [Alphaproteobacteria bacterium]